MKSRWFVWLVAILIGTALAFPPIISAAEKKKAAQPCAPAKMEEKKEMKEEKKEKKAAKKKAEKGMEKAGEKKK